MKLLTITISLVLIGCGHGITSGEGKKIGQVIQLGKHGVLCTTYEGKLVRGGFNTGSGVSGGVFDFTVEGDDLFNRLNTAMEKQQEIEVRYTKVNLSGLCTSDSDHFVTGFNVVSDTTPSVVVTPKVDSDRDKKKADLLRQLQELESTK